MIYKPNQVVLFYGINNPFSQFYPCKFTVTFSSEYKIDDEITFTSAEQYMMYMKAIMFGDLKSTHKILGESCPKKIKILGRKIKNFDEEEWNHDKLKIVTQGNIYKFSQDPILKAILYNTKNKLLIEASPYDRVWGVGIGIKNKDIYDTDKWKGENLLGKALITARRHIMNKEKKEKKITNELASDTSKGSDPTTPIKQKPPPPIEIPR